MKSKLMYGIFTGAILFGTTAVPAMAATSQDQLYDEGRAYNNQLANSTAYNGYSTVVISDSAIYYNSQGWGRERIRAWGRLDTINDEYPYPAYTNFIQQINTEFYSGNSSLMLTATDPVTNLTSYTLPPFVYDILGYMGIQTNTIQALVNNISTSGTQVVQNTGYNFNVNFLEPDYSTASLPNTVSYSNADQTEAGNYSGVEAKFQYNLPSTDYNYPVTAAASAEYEMYDNTTQAPFYMWTNNATVSHTVNTQ